MNLAICWSTKKAIEIYDCHCHLSLLHNEIHVSFRSVFKGSVSRNSAKLGNYKMPIKLKDT